MQYIFLTKNTVLQLILQNYVYKRRRAQFGFVHAASRCRIMPHNVLVVLACFSLISDKKRMPPRVANLLRQTNRGK